ncbi:MAG: hypothetical protein ACKOY8_02695 [Verrucomicrobiota bacterium]
MTFRPGIFWRCALGRCPDCGASLPRGWSALFDVPPACPSCGMALRRGGGFFLGAIVWNYGLIAFGALPAVAVAHWTGLIGPGAAVKLAVAAVLLLPVLLNGLSWRLWLGTYYGFLPEQLPSGGRRADD